METIQNHNDNNNGNEMIETEIEAETEDEALVDKVHNNHVLLSGVYQDIARQFYQYPVFISYEAWSLIEPAIKYNIPYMRIQRGKFAPWSAQNGLFYLLLMSQLSRRVVVPPVKHSANISASGKVLSDDVNSPEQLMLESVEVYTFRSIVKFPNNPIAELHVFRIENWHDVKIPGQPRIKGKVVISLAS